MTQPPSYEKDNSNLFYYYGRRDAVHGIPQEDTSGEFEYGGWTVPYRDSVSGEMVRNELNQSAEYLLGRKTFEIWENYWPLFSDFWPNINSGTKHVLSGTRTHSSWNNSHFLKSLEDIDDLRKSDGPDLQVWGSGMLSQLLLKHQLVDQIRLRVYPMILGKGKKLFSEDGFPSTFRLTYCTSTPKGVIFANYERITGD